MLDQHLDASAGSLMEEQHSYRGFIVLGVGVGVGVGGTVEVTLEKNVRAAAQR